MKIALIGGSGSLGRALARKLKDEDRVVIYSRTEGRQQEMAQELPEGGPRGLRYILGDVTDYRRLCEAIQGCDVVVHAAADKMIDACTYNIYQSTKNNIYGTENVARACNEVGVSIALFVSSDKACNAVSAYGAQKFLGEQLFTSSNNYGKCIFNSVRYGNCIASNKSMFHTWRYLAISGKPIPVTHADMTRFYWSIEEAAQFILDRINNILRSEDRGCIYVPRMNSYKLMDIARTYSHNIVYTGLRGPEKIHEELVSRVEANHTYDRGDHYIIYPGYHNWCDVTQCIGAKVPSDFTLTSEGVSEWNF